LVVLPPGIVTPAQAEDAADDAPRAHDPRLLVERYAAAPDIVHPIGLAFDSRGRLLVIESHTHFPPRDYQGLEHDRVRLLEDTDGDGKADRFTTFFEGTQRTMDIAVHPGGAVYLATRNEILRLRDTDGDGTAEEKQRIAFLETAGDYPHNGLSGLAFDSRGNLFFGLGENLGASYKLIGADGTTLTGEGEGGNIYWCTADGEKLRRLATGFWNPFGICTDIFGRIFAVDNDPDAMPPCRLLHVVEGGDYGYQFRYGRSGRHPFQAWNGQLPGTLPMAAGTGEAPCEVLSYESDGLPPEYLGDLLVTAWADHRIERYVVRPQGASVTAERKPFVQGGQDFRPGGLAVAPDGSLFVSDWVLSNYQLHGRGAVWHIRLRNLGPRVRPADPRRAFSSRHRPLREAAARQLLEQGEAGRQFLREQLGRADDRVRAAALTALIDAGDAEMDLQGVAQNDPLLPLRALAVRGLAARGEAARFLDEKYAPAMRREAIASLKTSEGRRPLLELLINSDPFLRQAALHQLASVPDLLAGLDPHSLPDVRQRQGMLLAHRASGRPEGVRLVTGFLKDPDPEVRFLAAKWIADEKVAEGRAALVEGLAGTDLSVRQYQAYATALARLDGREVSEARLADYFLTRLTEPKSPPALRATLLRLVPTTNKKLTLGILTELLKQDDPVLQLETVRTLADHPASRRARVLLEVAGNPRYPDAVRAEALVGASGQSPEALDTLLTFARGKDAALREEALRALVSTRLSAAQCQQLEEVAERHPTATDLVARVLGKPFVKDRPGPGDTDAWLQRLEGPADAAAGRRVFFQPQLAGCARCHRVDGRGQDIGPDLSAVGRTERRHILESILQPDVLVAPHYQVWWLATADGRVFTGMLTHTNLDEYTYVDAKGDLFKLNTRTILESQALPRSIMPASLADLLTDQELRDVLAYLSSRR
jgi:putative membrane-bound dehydrogenase-like protein